MDKTSTEDLVSIIIPTHNRSELLPETLLSVVAQDYPNIEIIIVDDHSTDNTQMVVKEFVAKHGCNNLFLITNEGRGGCNARNTGIKKAKGQFIQFFDDDDIMNTNYISFRLRILKEKNLDFVTCDYVCFKENINNIIREKNISAIPHTAVSHIMNLSLLTACFLLTRQAVEKIGFWNQKLLRFQDMAYFHRLFLYSLKGEWCSEHLFKYRIHDNRITQRHGLTPILDSLDEMYKEWANVSKNVCLALVRIRICYIQETSDISTLTRILSHFSSACKYPKEYYIFFKYLIIKRKELFNWK